MTSVGFLLKKERERKKITLDQISEETRIGKKYLVAIEADNYTIFPGETYIIGFIRNYARAVGLNSSDVISQYKTMKINSSVETVVEESPAAPVPEPAQEIVEAPEEIEFQEEEPEEIQEVKEVKPANDDFEVVELMNDTSRESFYKTPGKKPEVKKERKEFKPLFKKPLKEKRLINVAHVTIGGGALLIVILLFFIIRFIIQSFSKKDTSNISIDLNQIRILEFTGTMLQSDFVANEYYKIKLGEKSYSILFEKLTELKEAGDDNNIVKEDKSIEFVFHIDDITIPLKLKEDKIIDFDYDIKNDLKVSVISHNDDLINARIDKLHSFIVVKTNEKVDVAEDSNTNSALKKVERPRTEGSGIKEKIIFDAEVIKRKTYFKAWLDGNEKEGQIYYPGKKISLEANDVMQLKIGDAGALKVKINGKEKKLGKVGEIVNKVIKWERDPYDPLQYNLIMKDWQ